MTYHFLYVKTKHWLHFPWVLLAWMHPIWISSTTHNVVQVDKHEMYAYIIILFLKKSLDWWFLISIMTTFLLGAYMIYNITFEWCIFVDIWNQFLDGVWFCHWSKCWIFGVFKIQVWVCSQNKWLWSSISNPKIIINWWHKTVHKVLNICFLKRAHMFDCAKTFH